MCQSTIHRTKHYISLFEQFARACPDQVQWDVVGINEQLSESFIREFKDKLDIHIILKTQKLSKSLRSELSMQ